MPDLPTARNWRALARAASLTLLWPLLLGLLLAAAPAGITVDSLQGGETAPDAATLAAATEAHPGWAVAFFVGDSLFVLSSAWFYIALFRALPRRPLTRIMLAAGLVKVAADLAENTLQLAGAAQVLHGGLWPAPPLDALFWLALVKRGAAVATALAAGLSFHGGYSGWPLRLAFLLSGLAALGGFFFEGLNQGYAAGLFLTLLLVFWYALGVLRTNPAA